MNSSLGAKADGAAGLPGLFPDRRVGDVIDNLFRLPERVMISDRGCPLLVDDEAVLEGCHRPVDPESPRWVPSTAADVRRQWVAVAGDGRVRSPRRSLPVARERADQPGVRRLRSILHGTEVQIAPPPGSARTVTVTLNCG